MVKKYDPSGGTRRLSLVSEQAMLSVRESIFFLTDPDGIEEASVL
jgi:hypothetical protein